MRNGEVRPEIAARVGSVITTIDQHGDTIMEIKFVLPPGPLKAAELDFRSLKVGQELTTCGCTWELKSAKAKKVRA